MPHSDSKVILSWSGKTSSKVALALSRFLKLTLHACEPWVSTQNIAIGSFWHEELWRALRTAKIGIVCLTPDNANSKWIHFEAGVIAKAFGKVFTCPYLFGLQPSDLPGPLQHLQCTSADKQGTFRLVQEINKLLTVGQLEPDMLVASFNAHWHTLDDTLKKIANEEKSERQSEERIELTDSRTGDERNVSYEVREGRLSDGSKELLLTKMIMHEFILGILEPDPSREPPPLFHLNRYSEATLFKLLKCTKDLETIVHDEIMARRRVLIPKFENGTVSQQED